MLRFIRKLEQNFLQLSGFYKYLIYGATEITLLVVGIIIALQVNTWSQQRNDRDLEQYYVKTIHEEVIKDINDIEEVIDHDEIILEAINSLLTLMKEEKSISDQASMPYWAATFLTTGANPNTIVFEDMQSSGRLSLLSSTELRFQIQQYYDYTLEAHTDVANNTQLMYQWFNDYFISKGPDINSLYSSLSPTIVEVNPYNPASLSGMEMNQIVDRLSVRYALTELNVQRHRNSLRLARNLAQDLATHLEELN